MPIFFWDVKSTPNHTEKLKFTVIAATTLNRNYWYKRGVVTSMTSFVFEKQKLQIVRTHSKITQIKQEKTQSYASLQGASNECRLNA
jgi:hypothetical protein